MLKLACVNQPGAVVSTVEIERGGVSYTVDTLSTIHAERPHDELYFLMGADSLADLPSWHRPAEICRLATPLVVQRPESPPPDFEPLSAYVDGQRFEKICNAFVEMPPAPISSSQIRRSIATGGSWHEMVPSEVAAYIEEHQLYLAKR